MMKSNLLLPLAICCLIACETKNTTSTPSIKGEWEEWPVTATDEPKHVVSFEDSICSNFLPYGDYLKYTINKDTLFMQSFPGAETPFSYTCKITGLTDSSLALVSLKKTDDSDTILFRKIKTKNQVTPSTIYFASSGCFGSCASMNLQLDSSGHLLFYGGYYSDLEGGHSGQVSKSDYNAILRLIRNLPIDSLKKFYEAPWTDDQTCGVAIISNNRTIKSTAYGYCQEPVELRLLFHKLMELHKTSLLKKDTIITDLYFSQIPDCLDLLNVPSLMPPPIKPPKQ